MRQVLKDLPATLRVQLAVVLNANVLTRGAPLLPMPLLALCPPTKDSSWALSSLSLSL